MKFDFLKYDLTKVEAKQLNSLILAFIGDAVYEVFIRIYVVNKNKDMHVHKVHKKVVSYVKAHAQSDFMKKIIDDLNDEEFYIFKRGRNAKSGTVPKNADVVEYRMATGFEALIGYLYITGQHDRLNKIICKIIVENEGE